MSKNILITGGTGFIGRELCRQLLERGDTLTILSRQAPETVKAVCGRVQCVSNLTELRDHQGFSAVINLAGEGIAEKRWTAARKQALRDSRIALTETLVQVMQSWSKSPEVLVSGSAVGFYGDQGDHTVNEDTQPRDEFTHQLCRDWENAAGAARDLGVRVCVSRTGLVVGPGGGFLQRMVPPFRFGLGGRLGSGTQYMPWVHRADVVNALIWMLDHASASGAYNVVSPDPVTNREFTATLGKVLHRPTPFPAPAMALKLALGEMAGLLLTGQRAIPYRLSDEGFRFEFPELQTALEDALRRGTTA
ncbi:Epimerase family protein yfcH [Marinobacter santoriniensis NKSG1]|uniref:Epimerase family protein yfcH n=1 Tax=Marinobacter santoriniensis NKSG1 TaxID=1288826 RepID=M7CST7_9GAMM|nr:TIGR01777 family oxidoreductase [Marinobacter santoriniensis]EMP56676.1 Epimerase family protein yfcH [Marinobacter santoriniensis NKSG1]